MRLNQHSIRAYFVIAVMVLATSGCATSSKNDQRVQALQLKLKKQRALLQDLKERNLVLEKRSRLAKPQAVEREEMGESIGEAIVTSEPPTELPASFGANNGKSEAARPALIAKNLPTKLPAHLSVVPNPILTGAKTPPAPIIVSSEKTGEHYLYSKILETYRTKNTDDLQRTTDLLVKSYPDSVFADNAVYLNGLLAFENGDTRAAMKNFDRLLRDYPRSNKAVAALFAKATIDRRLGHLASAKKRLLDIRDLYPGSPEAARVSGELKLLESASVKHREL